MSPPDDRLYAESHEWHLVNDDVATIGITAFAVEQLTDITFAEMKPAGTAVGPGETIGEVESVKTTSYIYSAVAGEIVEVNPELAENPAVISDDPYDKGWLVKIRITDRSGLERLVDAKTYERDHAA